MLEFFEYIGNIIITLMQFLGNMITSLVQVLLTIPEMIAYLGTLIAYLPAPIIAFATLSITVTAVFLIIGRN